MYSCKFFVIIMSHTMRSDFQSFIPDVFPEEIRVLSVLDDNTLLIFQNHE